jgi:hypothetical protein
VPGVVVVRNREEARALVAAGEAVVLVVAPDDPPLADLNSGPGRLAILVGSLSDPEVRQAAEAMDAELFGYRRQS